MLYIYALLLFLSSKLCHCKARSLSTEVIPAWGKQIEQTERFPQHFGVERALPVCRRLSHKFFDWIEFHFKTRNFVFVVYLLFLFPD